MSSRNMREIHEANRASWNAAVIAHNSHKGNQIRFFERGGDTLFPEESELLGELDGRRLLHLQCNCGQDTLSLARRGAKVVGVDISDQAIDFARHLSMRTGIPAGLHRADLYDWLAEFSASGGEPFHVVFSSYGALRYLSNLDLWAESIARVLAPGGRLVLVDFHPVVYMFDRSGRVQHPYSAPGKPRTGPRGVIDYVGRSGPDLSAGEYHEGIREFTNPYPHHTFHWGLGEVVQAMLRNGLRIRHFQEYPYCNGHRYFDAGTVTEGRRVMPPDMLIGLPMMFGLRAEA